MNTTIRRKAARLSRRTFIVGSAAASGGLALGLRLPDGMDVHLLRVRGGSGGSTTEDPTSFRLKELIGEHP